MDLDRALRISAAGMQAQATRLRVVAENIANSDSTGQSPGAEPYRRKTITFGAGLEGKGSVGSAPATRIGTQAGDFPQSYDPGHPAADANGYVKRPNIDPIVESMDMREAQRSYAANLSVLEVTRSMLTRTIEALR